MQCTRWKWYKNVKLSKKMNRIRTADPLLPNPVENCPIVSISIGMIVLRPGWPTSTSRTRVKGLVHEQVTLTTKHLNIEHEVSDIDAEDIPDGKEGTETQHDLYYL